MLPDRQTACGDKRILKPFLKVLDAGILKRANEVCKRLRKGFHPHDMSWPEFDNHAQQIVQQKREKGEGVELLSASATRRLQKEGKTRHYERQVAESLLTRRYPEILGYRPPVMSDREQKTFVLYADSRITVFGNTNASHGYVYLIAFPIHMPVDLDMVLPSDEYPTDKKPPISGVYWSGELPIPEVGSTVNNRFTDDGESLVLAYMIEHNFLGLVTIPLEESEGSRDRREKSVTSLGHPYSATSFAYGNDLRRGNG